MHSTGVFEENSIIVLLYHGGIGLRNSSLIGSLDYVFRHGL
jgi:hypothetical protein